ncbi:MAG: right-handed parallel beta-helix repeat-containing protein [bacterium]
MHFNNFLITFVLLWVAASAGGKTIVADASGAKGLPLVGLAFRVVIAGDTILVKPGTYNEGTGSWKLMNGLTIIGEGGPEVTKCIFKSSGDPVRIGGTLDEHISDVTIKGLDISNKEGQENTIRVHYGENILIQDCIIHDAGADGDCIKITYSKNINIDHCVIYNPGLRASSDYAQECVDMIDTWSSTISNSWLFHVSPYAHCLCYPKGGCGNILYENNIFGPFNASPATEFGGVVGYTGVRYYAYSCTVQTMRNNLFLHCDGDVVQIAEASDCYFYNNVVYNCGNAFSYKASDALADEARNGWIYNNIFLDDRGRMKTVYGWSPRVAVRDFKNDYNIYYNNGNSILYGARSKGINDIVADPLLVNPHMPSVSESSYQLSQIQQIKSGFMLKNASPAVNAGIGQIQGAELFHPDFDFLGDDRPFNGAVDIGPHEHGSSSGNILWKNTIDYNNKPILSAWSASPDIISLRYKSSHSGYANLSVFDIAGKIVAWKKLFTVAGEQTYIWPLPEKISLTTGFYIAKYTQNNESVFSKFTIAK